MRRTLVAAALIAAGVVAFGAPAAAERPELLVGNPNALCAGLALSEHAVNDGAGAIAGIITEVQAAAHAFGFANAGQVISRFAHVHAGSHVPGCEDAFVQLLTEGPDPRPERRPR